MPTYSRICPGPVNSSSADASLDATTTPSLRLWRRNSRRLARSSECHSAMWCASSISTPPAPGMEPSAARVKTACHEAAGDEFEQPFVVRQVREPGNPPVCSRSVCESLEPVGRQARHRRSPPRVSARGPPPPRPGWRRGVRPWRRVQRLSCPVRRVARSLAFSHKTNRSTSPVTNGPRPTWSSAGSGGPTRNESFSPVTRLSYSSESTILSCRGTVVAPLSYSRARAFALR